MVILLTAGQVENPIVSPVEIPWFLTVAFRWFQGQPVFSGLILLMLIDIVAGTALSVIRRTLSSKVSWRGMCRKCITLMIIGGSAVVQPFLPNVPLVNLISFFFTVTEFKSILESAAAAGVPLPRGLVEAMVQIRDQRIMADAQKVSGMVINQVNVTPGQPVETGSRTTKLEK